MRYGDYGVEADLTSVLCQFDGVDVGNAGYACDCWDTVVDDASGGFEDQSAFGVGEHVVFTCHYRHYDAVAAVFDGEVGNAFERSNAEGFVFVVWCGCDAIDAAVLVG